MVENYNREKMLTIFYGIANRFEEFIKQLYFQTLPAWHRTQHVNIGKIKPEGRGTRPPSVSPELIYRRTYRAMNIFIFLSFIFIIVKKQKKKLPPRENFHFTGVQISKNYFS